MRDKQKAYYLCLCANCRNQSRGQRKEMRIQANRMFRIRSRRILYKCWKTDGENDYQCDPVSMRFYY